MEKSSSHVPEKPPTRHSPVIESSVGASNSTSWGSGCHGASSPPSASSEAAGALVLVETWVVETRAAEQGDLGASYLDPRNELSSWDGNHGKMQGNFG